MLTSKQCTDRFGDPKSAESKNMILWTVPEDIRFGVIPKKTYCNKLMVEPLTKAFRNLKERGFAGELKEWNGIFTIRKMRGSNSMSLHSWGVAIDLNASTNQMGKQPKLSAGFVKCFTDAGFEWGGNWKSPDGMHFQLGEL